MPRHTVDTRRDTRAEGFFDFGDQGTFFRVTESAAPELMALAEKFPRAFSRALKSVGYMLRGRLRDAMVKGGPDGARWPELSRMHIYRRMDLLRAGKVDNAGQWAHGKRFALKRRGRVDYALPERERGKLAARGAYSFWRGRRRFLTYTRGGRLRTAQSIPNAFARWQGRGILRGAQPMGGNLQKAIRYKMVNAMRVDIGAVSASAAVFLAAVQAGRRGTKGAFEFARTQPVTPKMRRAFWAAGIPLAKSTHELRQEPRPLVAPVYQQVSPRLEAYLVGKIREYLEG